MRLHPAISTFLILVLLCGGAFAAWRTWLADDRPQRVEELQSTLIAQSFDENVSDWKRERTTEALVREFDQLTQEQREEARKSVREKFRETQVVAARAWKELPAEERAAHLDGQLNEFRKWQPVLFAMHTEDMHVPNRYRKSYVESEEGQRELAEEAKEREAWREQRAKRQAEAEKRGEGDSRGGERRWRRDGNSPRDGNNARGGNTPQDGNSNPSREERRRRWQARGGGGGGRGMGGGLWFAEIDENDPDAALLGEYRRAMFDHIRAKWSERQSRPESDQQPAADQNGPAARGPAA